MNAAQFMVHVQFRQRASELRIIGRDLQRAAIKAGVYDVAVLGSPEEISQHDRLDALYDQKEAELIKVQQAAISRLGLGVRR